jgi:hypothetical protein
MAKISHVCVQSVSIEITLPTTYFYMQPVRRIRDAYPGSRIRIFFHPRSRIRIFSIRIRIKAFKYFNPKYCFQALGNMIIVYPGSSFFTYPRSRIPDPGVKKAPYPGSGSATLHATNDVLLFSVCRTGKRDSAVRVQQVSPDQLRL